MADYRRWYQPGGTYFFTAVTYRRRALFSTSKSREILRDAILRTRKERPFTIVATVLLPEHLHTIWTLPAGDSDFSSRWKGIKSEFTKQFLQTGGREVHTTPAQQKDRRRGIWQRRFWEHLVENEDELSVLCDYIHYNPVKHGLVKRPRDWEWSTFKKFVAAGQYPSDWGRSEPQSVEDLDFE